MLFRSKRRRLLLLNLKDLYASFKETYPKLKGCFSKFSKLKLKYSILPGASVTHSVCVCTIHQNAKMMLEAIQITQLTKNTQMHLTNYEDCI